VSEFKKGDQVVYMLRNKPIYYATVVEVQEKGNRMWVEWHDNAYIKTQLMDCDNFELINRRRDND
jgi:hypothetical protein